MYVIGYDQKICHKKCQKDCQKICQKECQKICQKECQKICQKVSQKDCHKICQKEYQKICQKECQKICQKECQKICQKECQKESQKLCQKECQKTDDMSEDFCQSVCEGESNRTHFRRWVVCLPSPDPIRLTSNLTWLFWNVIVGITRSKVVSAKETVWQYTVASVMLVTILPVLYWMRKNNFTVQSDSCCVQTPLARVFPKPLSGFQVLPSFNQKTKLLKCSVPALRKKWSASWFTTSMFNLSKLKCCFAKRITWKVHKFCDWCGFLFAMPWYAMKFRVFRILCVQNRPGR